MGEKINKYEYMLSCFTNGNYSEIKENLKKFSKKDLCEFLLYYMDNCTEINTAYQMKKMITKVKDWC
jgi:hypothetical protein